MKFRMQTERIKQHFTVSYRTSAHSSNIGTIACGACLSINMHPCNYIYTYGSLVIEVFIDHCLQYNRPFPTFKDLHDRPWGHMAAALSVTLSTTPTDRVHPATAALSAGPAPLSPAEDAARLESPAAESALAPRGRQSTRPARTDSWPTRGPHR